MLPPEAKGTISQAEGAESAIVFSVVFAEWSVT